MYSSILPLTSALEGVGGKRHAPAALPPGKTRYPMYRRLGDPQGRSGRVRKILPPPTGIRSPGRPDRTESLYRLSYRGPTGGILNKDFLLYVYFMFILCLLYGYFMFTLCLFYVYFMSTVWLLYVYFSQ